VPLVPAFTGQFVGVDGCRRGGGGVGEGRGERLQTGAPSHGVVGDYGEISPIQRIGNLELTAHHGRFRAYCGVGVNGVDQSLHRWCDGLGSGSKSAYVGSCLGIATRYRKIVAIAEIFNVQVSIRIDKAWRLALAVPVRTTPPLVAALLMAASKTDTVEPAALVKVEVFPSATTVMKSAAVKVEPPVSPATVPTSWFGLVTF